MKLQNVTLKWNIRSLALPRPAQQHDSEYFFVTLEISLTTFLAKFSVSLTFFKDGTGQDGTGQTGQTNRQTYGQTDFSRKILF